MDDPRLQAMMQVLEEISAIADSVLADRMKGKLPQPPIDAASSEDDGADGKTEPDGDENPEDLERLKELYDQLK